MALGILAIRTSKPDAPEQGRALMAAAGSFAAISTVFGSPVIGAVGASCVSILRLPLSSVVIALLLSVKAGLAVAPLVIVAVVVAYLASEALTAYVDTRVGAAAPEAAT